MLPLAKIAVHAAARFRSASGLPVPHSTTRIASSASRSLRVAPRFCAMIRRNSASCTAGTCTIHQPIAASTAAAAAASINLLDSRDIPVLTAQLVEQRLGVLEVGGVEAFGEPVVDFGEHHTRFVAAIGVAQEPRERCGCAQFQHLRAQLLQARDRLAKISFGLIRLAEPDKDVAADAYDFRSVNLIENLRGERTLNRVHRSFVHSSTGLHLGDKDTVVRKSASQRARFVHGAITNESQAFVGAAESSERPCLKWIEVDGYSHLAAATNRLTLQGGGDHAFGVSNALAVKKCRKPGDLQERKRVLTGDGDGLRL